KMRFADCVMGVHLPYLCLSAIRHKGTILMKTPKPRNGRTKLNIERTTEHRGVTRTMSNSLHKFGYQDSRTKSDLKLTNLCTIGAICPAL
ncbi:hypothetical protein P3X46_019996, partial [Hevea brasiliensis]